MADVMIEVVGVDPGWRGRWWSARWRGIEIVARSRDPLGASARLLLKLGHVEPLDELVAMLGGVEIGREVAVFAAKRRPMTAWREELWSPPPTLGPAPRPAEQRP